MPLGESKNPVTQGQKPEQNLPELPADEAGQARGSTDASTVGWFFLRPSHQLVVALGILIALAFMVPWLYQISRDRWIPVEPRPHLAAKFLIDINTANWAELAQLPGIGEVVARRIVAHREKHGPFRSHEELLKVSGIGPKTFERIRRYLAPIKIPP